MSASSWKVPQWPAQSAQAKYIVQRPTHCGVGDPHTYEVIDESALFYIVWGFVGPAGRRQQIALPKTDWLVTVKAEEWLDVTKELCVRNGGVWHDATRLARFCCDGTYMATVATIKRADGEWQSVITVARKCSK